MVLEYVTENPLSAVLSITEPQAIKKRSLKVHVKDISIMLGEVGPERNRKGMSAPICGTER